MSLSAMIIIATHLSAVVRSEPTCDVTTPNRNVPPPEIVQQAGYSGGPASLMHGNGVLWTGLWPDGTVRVKANQILPDGSLRMKFFWFVAGRGRVAVTGKRLDAASAPLRSEVPAGFEGTGFQPSWLIFPSEGCWEVTARLNGKDLTFVTRVAKAS